MTSILKYLAVHWQWVCIVTVVLTTVLRFGLTNEYRAEVSKLFAQQSQEESLIKENNRLSLERGVLVRPARLQEYATKNLAMRKPREIRRLELQSNE